MVLSTGMKLWCKVSPTDYPAKGVQRDSASPERSRSPFRDLPSGRPTDGASRVDTLCCQCGLPCRPLRPAAGDPPPPTPLPDADFCEEAPSPPLSKCLNPKIRLPCRGPPSFIFAPHSRPSQLPGTDVEVETEVLTDRADCKSTSAQVDPVEEFVDFPPLARHRSGPTPKASEQWRQSQSR